MQCILFAFQNESENEDCESDQPTTNQQSIRNVTRPCQLGFDKNVSNQVCISLDLLLNRSLCRYSNLSSTNIREQRRWVTSQESKAGQQCWESLRPCQQWCANGCNNSQQHEITCNNMQQCANVRNIHSVTSNNFRSCWPTKSRPFARGLKFLYGKISFKVPFSALNVDQFHYSLFADAAITLSRRGGRAVNSPNFGFHTHQEDTKREPGKNSLLCGGFGRVSQ